MNNKITIYELLGLIKDGQAPKKIEYDTEKYIWESKLKEYRRYPYDNNLYYSLWSDYDLTKCLNDEVEILDNEDENKKIPEKLDVIAYEKCIHEVTHKEKKILLNIRDIQINFNKIIDYLMENKQ